MKPYISSFLLSFGLVAVLGAQVSTPAVGFVRYPGLPVEAVYGIAGNLIAGLAVWGVADGLSFGRSGGLVAGGGHILLVRADGSVAAEYASAESHPLLNIGDTLDTAVAWLPASRTFLWAKSLRQFSALTVAEGVLSGTVSSVSRISAQTARFLVTQADGTVAAVKISLSSGDVESSDTLPGVRGPGYEFDGRFVWLDERGLEIGAPGGTIQTVPTPSAGSLTAERMSGAWVHLFFGGADAAHWALNLSGPSVSVFRLPASVPAGGGGR